MIHGKWYLTSSLDSPSDFQLSWGRDAPKNLLTLFFKNSGTSNQQQLQLSAELCKSDASENASDASQH
eukprot:scaffold44768_cov49-Cyclotella_meneghiniana.AAC.4